METIECAAVRAGKLVLVVQKPLRHHDIFWELDRLNCPRIFCVQGFITSTGRFVEREEARKLADFAGQINECVAADGVPFKRQHRELFSEDVW